MQGGLMRLTAREVVVVAEARLISGAERIDIEDRTGMREFAIVRFSGAETEFAIDIRIVIPKGDGSVEDALARAKQRLILMFPNADIA
jgi:hypothetical protein